MTGNTTSEDLAPVQVAEAGPDGGLVFRGVAPPGVPAGYVPAFAGDQAVLVPARDFVDLWATGLVTPPPPELPPGGRELAEWVIGTGVFPDARSERWWTVEGTGHLGGWAQRPSPRDRRLAG
jgi:hypothetical protein